MQNMTGHDNSIVYHQVERNGNTGQRIKLHFQSEDIIENSSYGYVDSQAGYYQKQITQIAGNQCNKQQ